MRSRPYLPRRTCSRNAPGSAPGNLVEDVRKSNELARNLAGHAVNVDGGVTQGRVVGEVNMQESEAVRRVTVRVFGGPEQMTLETVAEAPSVGPGQLLVDVEACGIN